MKRKHKITEIPLDEYLLLRSKVLDNGCIVWTGATRPKGYGQFTRHYVNMAAHRVAWELVHGTIPKGIVICHKCDNPPCINVDHLFIGTKADNNRDMHAKKRHRFGSRHPNSKLTEWRVSVLRKAYARGVRICDLARRLRISQPALSAMFSDITWRHVPLTGSYRKQDASHG